MKMSLISRTGADSWILMRCLSSRTGTVLPSGGTYGNWHRQLFHVTCYERQQQYQLSSLEVLIWRNPGKVSSMVFFPPTVPLNARLNWSRRLPGYTCMYHKVDHRPLFTSQISCWWSISQCDSLFVNWLCKLTSQVCEPDRPIHEPGLSSRTGILQTSLSSS